MSDQDLFLAIDQGTQSVRAMLFDLQGQLVAKAQQFIEPYFSTQPNWAEQDCEYIWQNLSLACQQLWQKNPELKSRVVAGAFTCQRASMVCLDKDMQPIRPATIWLDSRRTDKYPKLPLWLQAGIKLAGQQQIMYQLQSKAECNWLAADFPEDWKKTKYFVQLSAYLTLKLTGNLVDVTSSQVGYLPYDFKNQQWSAKHDIKWHALTAKRKQMCKLVQPSELLGNISSEASQATGIPQGLKLFAAGADKACEVLAAGAISPDIGCISYGTTATINTCNDKYVEPMPFVPAYNAAIPNHYTSEIIVQRGYWMVNWFKREFAQQETIQAEQQGISAESLFEQLLLQSPAGAQGLVLQPFWNPGVKFPGPEAKGAIIGFGDVHTRAHLYRAIIEGIAYALRQGKDQLEKRNKVAITRLKVAGGGSQSDAIMQITANIFGIPAERPHTFEASGLGAAINAAVGAKYYANHQEAVKHMSHTGKIFYPEPVHAQLYNDLYEQVYTQMYGKLAPLYRSIRQITGYPKH